MATMERWILCSICLITSTVKSENLNSTDPFLSASRTSVQESGTEVSSTSVLFSIPSSVSESSLPILSLSISTSRLSLESITTSSSVNIFGSISTTAGFSSSTITVSQSVQPVTQNISNTNSTTEESESITTIDPGTVSTDFSFNKWSNTFPGITSNAGSTGITNPSVEPTSVSQNNSSDLENNSPQEPISSVWNDTINNRKTSSIVQELINATQTSGTGLPTTKMLATEHLTSDSLHSSTTEIGMQSSQPVSNSILSSKSLPQVFSSPLLGTFSVSDFVSMSRFVLPSLSASNHTSTRIANVSKSETILASSTTDYFTESVYSLANISSTYVADMVSAPSAGATTGKSSEIIPGLSSILHSHTMLVSSVPSLESDSSLTLSPTQTYTSSDVTNSLTALESIYSSQIEIHMSSSVVSSSSGYVLEPSSSSMPDILANDTFNVNKTPTIESTSGTLSTSSISLTVSEASNKTLSLYYFTSNVVSSEGVTQGSSISPTTASLGASIITFTTSQTTIQVPTSKSSTASTHTTLRNSTEPSVEMERRVYRLMFTFEGNCEISENEILQIEFLKALMSVTKSTTKLIEYTLEAERILCEPFRVYLRAETRGLNKSNLSVPLKNKIALTDFVVPIIQNTHVANYTATNLEIVELLPSDSNEIEMARSGLEVVDIVIISIASFLFAVLVLMMVIVICRECYVRKRTTTFHLRDVPHVNLKLSEFTLTRIPRPQMFYRENSRRKHGPVPVSKIRKPQTNGHSDTKDKVKVNQDQIRVRMSKHDDGLVVGVTCSAPPSPTNNASSCSSTPKNGDSCKTSLLKGGYTEISDGVTNPSYSTDEELNGNTKIVILEDENEQLL